MKTRRRVLAALGVACLAATAAAQQVELAPSDAVSCLTMPDEQRGGPEYPFAALKLGRIGRVKMQAEFTGPDRRPEMTVLESEGDDTFIDAVKSHVRTWRVPCLGSSPARLVREFVFKPDDRKVYYGETRDADDPARLAKLACQANSLDGAKPAYPRDAERIGLQGRVLARVRYSRPDEPPTVELYARPRTAALQGAVRDWLQHQRLPCLGDEPITTNMVFIFRLGDDAWGLKPLTLLELLSRMKGLDECAVAIDTAPMGCPFVLRFWYRQPAMRNVVGAIGSDEPARQPLLELLRALELDLPERSLDAVFGDTTTVTVPCLKIDLKPKEKS